MNVRHLSVPILLLAMLALNQCGPTPRPPAFTAVNPAPPITGPAPARRFSPSGVPVPPEAAARRNAESSTSSLDINEDDGLDLAANKDRNILLRSARNAVALGDSTEALHRFETLLVHYPRDHEARREYAAALATDNQLRPSIEQYLTLLDKKPDEPVIRTELAHVYIQAKEFERAANQLRISLEEAPDPDTALLLARVYAWNREYERAMRVYRTHLQELNSDDEDVQRLLAPFLLDTQRPQEALDYLLPLHEMNKGDIEISSLLVRCYTQIGEHGQALTTVANMAERSPSAIAERMDLTTYLREVGSYSAALKVFDQILALRPQYSPASIGKARVYLESYMPQQAMEILQELPEVSDESDYLMIKGQYHAMVAEYADAKRTFKECIRIDPKNHNARIQLGNVYTLADEFEQAKAEYRKVLDHQPVHWAARMALAQTLAEERRFAESSKVCRELLKEDSRAVQPIMRMAENMGEREEFNQAEKLCSDYLESNPMDESSAIGVRLAMGRVLIKAGRYLDAVYQFEGILAHPLGQIPAAFHGLSSAYNKLENKARGDEVLVNSTASVRGDGIRNRITIAELFESEGNFEQSENLYQEVMRWDPNHLMAQVRLADVQSYALILNSEFDSEENYRRVLAQSPSNIRARIGLARLQARTGSHEAALKQYELLLGYDSNNTVAMRERARVLFWSHNFDDALVAYDSLKVPSTIEELQIRLNYSGTIEEQSHNRHDFAAQTADHSHAMLEKHSKVEISNLRSYAAIPVLKRLLEVEPINQEARFDLAQAYQEVHQTRQAIHEYQELLKVNPAHREAANALDRKLVAPQFKMGLSRYEQDGRGDLEKIDRTRLYAWGQFPMGNDEEFVAVGIAHVEYDPKNASAVSGNILSARFQKNPEDNTGSFDRIHLHAQLNVEVFSDAFATRPTFDTGFQLELGDQLDINGNIFMENVVENGETIRQDIHRLGGKLGATFQAARRWQYGGELRYVDYSDDNSLLGIHLFTNMNITLPPKELKVTVNYDFQDFREETMFAATPNLVGTIHPYFSPSSYSVFSGGLEWRHHLSRDFFRGANLFWYQLDYTMLWDSDSELYHKLGGILSYDFSNMVTVGLEAQALRGQVLDYTFIAGNVTVRF